MMDERLHKSLKRDWHVQGLIGTKKATKMIKDGDLFEVRGNHGLVNIMARG